LENAAEILRSILPAIQRAADVRVATADALSEPGRLDRLGPRVHALAIGKASLEMMAQACAKLGDRVVSGLLTAVPERIGGVALPICVRVLPADHPLPTARNLVAAARVREFVTEVPAADTLLVLISGGGSAHLACPADGVSLEDLRSVTSALQRAGATIDELNAVRKHCEELKGGRLAAMSRARLVEVLIVSDVIGDRRDVISSGPFAPDDSTFAEALDALGRHAASGHDAVRTRLERGARGLIPETPKAGEPCFARVRDAIIANNEKVVAAAQQALAERGVAMSPRTSVVGESAHVARELTDSMNKSPTRGAWGFGGEWTVRVGSSGGVGGPSQELALVGAGFIRGSSDAAILAYSTDGIDGPTDAAGAIVDGGTFNAIARAGRDPERDAHNHDSHPALDAAGCLLRTGPTGTNVNHIAIALRV